jgi:Zn-finger nucleic acid-binding protein
MTERQGVEIDYCPDCRGVWLDRGELDKIIDRAAASAPPAAPQPIAAAPAPAPQRLDDRRYDSDRGRHDSDRGRYEDRDRQQGYKKKKKKDFLGDLFDF